MFIMIEKEVLYDLWVTTLTWLSILHTKSSQMCTSVTNFQQVAYLKT